MESRKRQKGNEIDSIFVGTRDLIRLLFDAI